MSTIKLNNTQFGNNDLLADQFTFRLNSNGTDTSTLDFYKGEQSDPIYSKLFSLNIDGVELLKPRNIFDNSKYIYTPGDEVFTNNNWYKCIKETVIGTPITDINFWVSKNNTIFNSDDNLTTGRTLTASDINKHLIFNNILPQTFTLPPANSVPNGSFIYVRGGQSIATFNCSGTNSININNVGFGATSCTCFGSEAIMLVSNGNGDWRLTKINPRYSTFTTFSPVFGTSFANATIYTNGSGFSQKISSRVYLPSVDETAIFIAIDNTIVFDEIVNSTTKTANASFEVPPGSTYRFWLSTPATLSNNVTTVQSVTI